MKRISLIFSLIFILVLSACRATPAPTTNTEVPAKSAQSVIADTATPAEIAPTPETPFPPLVVRTTPERGEEIALDAPIELRFDQAMDTASVESAFGIDPPIKGKLDWVDDTTLRFTPAESYARGESYKISLDERAKSKAGIPLNKPLNLKFNTVGYLAVSSVQPAEGDKEILPDTTVTVLFNRPVVALTAIENQAALPQPLTFVPPVRGQGEWLNTSIYRFTPKEGFDPATTYTARIAQGLTAIDESVLADDFTWTFFTVSPQVSAIYPTEDSFFVSATPVISVAFNQPMNHASVEDAFSLKNTISGKTVAGTFAWSEGGLRSPNGNNYFGYYESEYDTGENTDTVGVETLAFTPNQPLAQGDNYDITIAATAAAKGKKATLTRAFASNFTVIPNLEIVNTYPRDGSDIASPYDDLEIDFSAPVDPASIRIGENILISPPVTATDVYSYFWDSNTAFVLSFPTDASSAYTVTVKGSIAGRDGQLLGQDTTVHWQTTPFEPMAYLHSTNNVSINNAYTDTIAYFSVRNLSQVEFKLYSLSQDDFIHLNGEYSWRAWDNFIPQTDDLLAQWTVDTEPILNQNALYKTNISQEAGDKLGTGLYFLTMTVPQDSLYPEVTGWDAPYPSQLILARTNHNLTLKNAADETLAWLTDLRTAEPVSGAKLDLHTEEAFVDTQRTNADGIVQFSYAPIDTWTPRFVFSQDPFAVAISQWDEGIQRWSYGIDTEDYLSPLTAKLYTDRAIYRPGQSVFFKGVARLDDDAHYSLPSTKKSVPITVYDSWGDEILNQKLYFNENGTFNGEIELANSARLGDYYIEANVGDEYFGGSFQVAEYRKPEFLVNVSTDKTEYTAGNTILLTANASYFFGGALKNANLRYNILSDDYFFRYTGKGYYDFTDYDFSRGQSDYFPGFGELIMEGDGKTNADGVFSLEVPADIAERSLSQQFTLEVTITDPDSGQTVSNRATAIVHKGKFYIGLRPEKYVATVGEESPVNILTVDWESQPVSKQDLTVIFYKHNWYSTRVQDEDGYYYWDSFVEDIPVFTTTLTTDSLGEGIANFIPESGGVHKIVAKGIDSMGNLVQSSTYLWVSGNKYINWRQENNNRIELVTDKKEYNVGDVATILVPHPYSGTVKALVTQERGRVYHSEVIDLPTNSEQLKIPITADMLPNMFVSVVILHAPDSGDPLPGFKVGYAQLPINVTEKEINITLTPDKAENYQPGDTVRYTITATDSAGNPVQAEFSLALVDKAILTLSQDSSTLLEKFWRTRGLGVGTAVSLSLSAERANQDLATEAKGGGGGGFEEAFSIIRGDFKDTAFWLADFETDKNGTGTIDVTLPDNLTTWVLTARGITADTLVGDDSVEIVSTKPLLVRPITPRFFVVGDVAELKMVVQNNTENALNAETLFDIDGAELIDTTARKTESIGAGESASLVYKVRIGVTDSVTVKFGASAADFEDAVALTLPVYRNSTPETVGTAGVLDADGARLEGIALPARFDPTQGDLTVTIEPSLAAGMRDSLNYLKHFPYECTEQIVSKFLPNITTYRAYKKLGIDNPELAENLPSQISVALQKLYASQNIDGGWGWWSNYKSNPLISAYVLLGLTTAQNSDFAVDADVIAKSAKYLRANLKQPKTIDSGWEANRQAFILYVLAEAGDGDLGFAVTLFDQREKLDIYGRAYLAMTFNLLNPNDDTRVQTLLSDITSEAIVSATGAHWEEKTPDYYNMNTDTRSTAIIIAALSRLDPQNALAPNAVRWLMSVRENGTWESTQEAAWAIIGLTDWMIATNELAGNYAWNASLNGVALGDGTVNANNIADKVSLSVAVQNLLADEVNRLILTRSPQNGDTASEGRLYYTAHLEYFKPVEDVQALERGIIVARQYSLANDESETAISAAKVGDIITVKVTLIAPHDLHYVMLEDPIPAGAEIIDRSLDTTSVVEGQTDLTRTDGYNAHGWGWWYFNHTELRDEKAARFADYLPSGIYEFSYQIRASLPGQYRVIPTHAEEMYFPEVFGRGDGGVFTITE